ncbi:hypothetical protein JVU11DRAFT_9683 [Chiua virens]|nr:hypothetical protein JVU11DRAFT_9683 [Chiua virens]
MTDAWTSLNHQAFMVFSIHLEKDSTPLTFPLDIIEVAKSNTGKALVTTFHEVLEVFGVSAKMLSVTCDNASNNEVMIDHLAKLNPWFGGEYGRT